MLEDNSFIICVFTYTRSCMMSVSMVAHVRDLLEAGADPDKFKSSRGWTALHAAAEYGHNEVVKTLIQANCDLNVKHEGEFTALHRAVFNGHNEVVNTLIQAKCDINVKGHEYTTLHCATMSEPEQTVKFFSFCKFLLLTNLN